MSREYPDVAIVGGGICGLTAALALERRGWTPTVYEAASEYRPVGAGILLQTNALLVLDRLGVAERVRDAGVSLADTEIRSPSGRVLQRFGLDAVERREFGYGFVAIHRAALQRILLDELDAEVRTGMNCIAVTDTETPTVRFADGTTVGPDVLVGADGIGSAVREAVSPSVGPQPFDGVVYRAVAGVELAEEHRASGFEVWGDGTYAGGAPVDGDRFYLFATAPEPLAVDGTDARATVAALRNRLDEFPDPVPAVVESLEPGDVFATGLADVPPLDRWHRDAVVLAGDAAHAMLPFAGQGAAQGVEDALALAHALDAHEERSAAFRAYETERKPRADRIRSESRRLGELGTMRSTLGCRVRNAAAGLLPAALLRRSRRRRAAGTSLPETGPTPRPKTGADD
ncbi:MULTISPECIES: FAD-dependent oxidoreductase [Halorussus]|uniref:FAD-dependent oxidoreductase n=1 Tax=Halorussus TaxID=1070314 RepID=UPI00209D6111|nr:NAD(P)/FAD-dependent oxidoreductase [Halorussus vallis]USZ75500.1 FAD-dependent monooxygenase [Halorussus vallis]